MKQKTLALPRAPLPRQTGGAHKTKKHAAWRKRKYKKPLDSEV